MEPWRFVIPSRFVNAIPYNRIIMLAYKYTFDDVMEKPLFTVPLQGSGKRSFLTTLIILPILMMIGVVLIVYSPVKMTQLLIEKIQDHRPAATGLDERNN